MKIDLVDYFMVHSALVGKEALNLNQWKRTGSYELKSPPVRVPRVGECGVMLGQNDARQTFASFGLIPGGALLCGACGCAKGQGKESPQKFKRAMMNHAH